jgi:hypothetical protein
MRHNRLQSVTQEFIDTHGFISLSETNEPVSNARYVVFTPVDDNPLKSQVTYYLDKVRSVYTVSEGNPVGTYWVYILAHPVEDNIYKIGYTHKDPRERLKEINSQTGVVGEYRLVYMFRTCDGLFLENMVHKELSSLRLHSRKEHFQVSREKAIETVKRLGDLYG